MYITEANMKEEMTERQYQFLLGDIPLTDLYELDSSNKRITAKFFSEESAEKFAAALREKGQPAVVYTKKVAAWDK